MKGLLAVRQALALPLCLSSSECGLRELLSPVAVGPCVDMVPEGSLGLCCVLPGLTWLALLVGPCPLVLVKQLSTSPPPRSVAAPWLAGAARRHVMTDAERDALCIRRQLKNIYTFQSVFCTGKQVYRNPVNCEPR